MDRMGTCLQNTIMKRIDERVLEFMQKTLTKTTRAQQQRTECRIVACLTLEEEMSFQSEP